MGPQGTLGLTLLGLGLTRFGLGQGLQSTASLAGPKPLRPDCVYIYIYIYLYLYLYKYIYICYPDIYIYIL